MGDAQVERTPPVSIERAALAAKAFGDTDLSRAKEKLPNRVAQGGKHQSGRNQTRGSKAARNQENH